MTDSAATAAAKGIDEDAPRSGSVVIDPVRARARALALASLDADAHSDRLDADADADAVAVEFAGNRVTVSLRDHVDFSLLGIFMGCSASTSKCTAPPNHRNGRRTGGQSSLWMVKPPSPAHATASPRSLQVGAATDRHPVAMVAIGASGLRSGL